MSAPPTATRASTSSPSPPRSPPLRGSGGGGGAGRPAISRGSSAASSASRREQFFTPAQPSALRNATFPGGPETPTPTPTAAATAGWAAPPAYPPAVGVTTPGGHVHGSGENGGGLQLDVGVQTEEDKEGEEEDADVDEVVGGLGEARAATATMTANGKGVRRWQQQRRHGGVADEPTEHSALLLAPDSPPSYGRPAAAVGASASAPLLLRAPRRRLSYGSLASFMTDGGLQVADDGYHGGGDGYGAGDAAPRALSDDDGDADQEDDEYDGPPRTTAAKWLKRSRWRSFQLYGFDRVACPSLTVRRYLAYYVPFFNWIRQYRWSYVQGDLVAAITMGSFYIPMSLSLAANLGHVPAMNGLYSFVFNPLIYAILGTCPQMIVGPEAAGSLLTGQVVKATIDLGHFEDEDGRRAAEVAGIVTFTAGLVILLAGIFRLGFLDNVLSRPFQRGFISAIGIVIFIDQLIPELGLSKEAADAGGVTHGSCIEKALFLIRNVGKSHGPTTAVSLGSFGIIMVCRYTSPWQRGL
jgi:hypothetical protein